MHLYSKDQEVWVFAGPGNNGGDGWCMARMLGEKGYKVCVIHAEDVPLSADNETNKKRYLEGLKGKATVWPILPDPIPDNLVVIDALFGTGLSRPVGGIWTEILSKVNELKVPVCSIDVPSGLHTEDGVIGPTVAADHTLSIHTAKLSYLMPECQEMVGEWSIVDIGLDSSSEEGISSSSWLVDSVDLNRLGWTQRTNFDHKGKLGHAMLVAGSKGMMGAAVLATMACLRSGAGLTTVLVPASGSSALEINCPEAMTIADKNIERISEIEIPARIASVGIGPGLGVSKETIGAITTLLNGPTEQPLVLDADALNIIASEGLLSSLPPGSVLTPHPGEFDRLFGKHQDRSSRIHTQRRMSEKLSSYIVLKGRYTAISSPDGSVYFNTTGCSALAKGGSGDILTGLITGLLARTGDPLCAAILGVYLHGKAGELAEDQFGKESVIGRDVIHQIGHAFKQIIK
jgi:NAD(P)H-hydrate epimerase